MRSAEPGRIGQRPGRAGQIERVFTEVAPGLWRTIYAFSAGRAAVADDAVAEAFARALERSDEIRDLKPWLYRTAVRAGHDQDLQLRAAAVSGDDHVLYGPSFSPLSPGTGTGRG